MPLDSIIVSVVVTTFLLGYMGVLMWADHQTRNLKSEQDQPF